MDLPPVQNTPVQLPTSPQSPYRKYVVLAIAALLLVVFGVATWFYGSQIKNLFSKTGTGYLVSDSSSIKFERAISNNLFLATDHFASTTGLVITVFDAKKNEILESKTIIAPDYVAGSSFDNTVQFNSKTNDVFYLTQGFSAYDGSCTNRDGSCLNRIYRINLKSSTSTLVFESEKYPTAWIINENDGSILLSFESTDYDKNITSRNLTKINASTGSVIFDSCCEVDQDVRSGFKEFILSSDDALVYQIKEQVMSGGNGAPLQLLLKIDSVDVSSGSTTIQDLTMTDWLSADTKNISPNGKFIAFYTGMNENYKLNLFDISSKKLTILVDSMPVKNFNLWWSGDSSKLFLLLDTSLSYYDFNSQQLKQVSGDPQNTSFIYASQPSTKYFVYDSADGHLKIFNLETQQSAELPLGKPDRVLGVRWY